MPVRAEHEVEPAKECPADLVEGDYVVTVSKVVADAPAKEKAEGKAKPEGVDALIVALAEALGADDFEGILRDPELAEAVAKQLGACAKHSKSINHPAGKQLIAS